MHLWNACELNMTASIPQIQVAADRDKTIALIECFLPPLKATTEIAPEDKQELWLGHLLMLFQADLIDAKQLLHYNKNL